MKKISFIFSILIFIFSLALFTGNSEAQLCDMVITSDAQYSQCCASGSGNSGFCAAYVDGPRCAFIENETDRALCCSAVRSSNVEACLSYTFKGDTVSENCSVITNDSQYGACCGTITSANKSICDGYLNNALGSGGTQNTNNLGGDLGFGNNVLITSASEDPGLRECAAIKFKTLLDILIWIRCVVNGIIIPLIFSLATLFFLWNVFIFIREADNKNKKEEARQRMLWGMLALFIMVSLWGIISIFSELFGTDKAVPMLQTKTYLDPSKASK